MTRIILSSAATFETDDALEKLARHPIHVTRIVTGIGMTQAAITAARTRELIRGRDVIFCCTAGTIGHFEGIKLFAASTVGLGSWDVRNLKTDLLSAYDPPLILRSLKFSLPTCQALCGLGISTQPDIVLESDNQSIHSMVVETMELYAVARAWLPLARSFSAIVATTNAIGDNARRDWQSNFKRAAMITSDFLSESLPPLSASGEKSCSN